MFIWAVNNLQRATTYVLRVRRGKRRDIEWTTNPVPFVARRRRVRASRARRLLSLCLPGLLVLLFGMANGTGGDATSAVNAVIFAAAAVLAVRAWVASASWPVRVLGLLCSLGYPIFRIVAAF